MWDQMKTKLVPYHRSTLIGMMVKLFCVDIIIFIICHFVSLIFFYILDLLGKMPMKVQFIRNDYNKIHFKKKTIKGCKTKKHKIQIDKNIE
jgi:hypothetical protein